MDKYIVKLNYKRFGVNASVSLWETDPSTSSNTSVLHVRVTVTTTGSSYNNDGSAYINGSVSCNGGSWAIPKTSFKISRTTTKVVYEGAFTVQHNSDGTCGNATASVYVRLTSSTTGTFNGGPIGMSTIPRYANITSFYVTQRDEHSVIYNYSVDATCDWAWYSINGGEWQNLPTNNIITGLSAGTTYNFRLKVERADSQLTSETGNYAQSTYAYPHITSAPNFIIGNALNIGIYNPLGRQVVVYLKDPLNNQTDGKTTRGTSVGDYTEETYTDFFYNGIPNSPDGQYSVRLVCSELGQDTTVNGGKYTVRGDEKPTFSNFTYTDINPTTIALSGSTDNNPIIINGYSTVQATVSVENKATGVNYANMDKYTLSDGKNSADATYSDDSAVTVTLQNFSNKEISLSAVDKRKLTTIVVKDSVFKDYSIPVVDSLTLSRNDGGVGQYGYISFYGEWWNDNFGLQNNAITDVSYYYKEMSQSEEYWVKGTTTITPTVSGNSFSVSSVQINGPLQNGGFDQTKTYDVKITITDKLGTSAEFKAVMVNAQPGIAIYNNCVSICTSYDTTLGGILQVNHGIVRDGHLLYNNPSGDNGNITLNDSVEDYLYIEVYYRSNDGYYGSQKIYEPNNKTIMLLSAYHWTDVYLKYKSISIVDDTISTDQYAEIDLPNGGSIGISGQNLMYIVQVIGYK